MLTINLECIIVVFVLLHQGRFDLISFQSQFCKSSPLLSTKVYINLLLFTYLLSWNGKLTCCHGLHSMKYWIPCRKSTSSCCLMRHGKSTWLALFHLWRTQVNLHFMSTCHASQVNLSLLTTWLTNSTMAN